MYEKENVQLEKANFFQEPTGIMTQAKDFFTKTVPNIAPVQ